MYDWDKAHLVPFSSGAELWTDKQLFMWSCFGSTFLSQSRRRRNWEYLSYPIATKTLKTATFPKKVHWFLSETQHTGKILSWPLCSNSVAAEISILCPENLSFRVLFKFYKVAESVLFIIWTQNISFCNKGNKKESLFGFSPAY